MQLIRINGQLAEIIATVPGRAKLVYLACEPEGRLPTEVEYDPPDLLSRRGRQRVILKSPDVLLIERVEPDLGHPLNPGKLKRKLLAKLGL